MLVKSYTFLLVSEQVLILLDVCLIQAKWNPLHTFALAGQIRFMDRLLEEGLDIDVVDKVKIHCIHNVSSVDEH